MQRELKLERLTVHRFKGLPDFEMALAGEDALVTGDNGVGKTTLLDAWTWLLFDKDSQGRSVFDVKPLDQTGHPEHGEEHMVEGELSLDGEALTLRKTLTEKWVKKRGQATKEFTGHETKYEVNGVPVTRTEYVARVAAICDEDAFKVLTEPAHFAERMHWQDRRELLLQIVGEVTDAEVIEANASLLDLEAVLGTRTMEEHRKVVQARRRKINSELERIPVRIDEVRRSMEDVTNLSEGELRGTLGAVKEQRKEWQDKLNLIGSEAAYQEAVRDERAAEAAIQEAKRAGIDALNVELDEQLAAVSKLMEQRESARRLERRCEDAIKQVEASEIHTQSELDRIAARQDEEDKLVGFEVSGSDLETTCPTCGQELPEDQVAAARAEAQAQFNERHAQARTELQQAETKLCAEMNVLSTSKQSHAEKLADTVGKIVTLDVDIEEAKERADQLRKSIDAWVPPADAQEKLDAAKARVDRLKQSSQSEKDAIEAKLDALDEEALELEHLLASIKAAAQARSRIDTLKSEERALAAEYEELERQLYLTEEFVRRKVEMLEARIDARFNLASFKMFKELVTGGLEECCEVTYLGVPYTTNLNHGARIQVGLDIIHTLQDHYQFSPPVWVDQAESVTQLPAMDCQVIVLKVEEGCDKLEVKQLTA